MAATVQRNSFPGIIRYPWSRFMVAIVWCKWPPWLYVCATPVLCLAQWPSSVPPTPVGLSRFRCSLNRTLRARLDSLMYMWVGSLSQVMWYIVPHLSSKGVLSLGCTTLERRFVVLMVRWRHHSLWNVCTCLPKTMSSAWKCLPSPHFTNTYEAKTIV